MAREINNLTRKTQILDNAGKLVREEKSYHFEELVSVSCDICGKKGHRDNSWSNSYYDVAETEVSVKYKFGENYPECGNSTTIEYDICPACFMAVLKPFLDSKGCSAIETEQDY